MAPAPRMVSRPVLSSVQVRLLPFAPQGPMATASADATVAPNASSAAHRAKTRTGFRLVFIMFFPIRMKK